MPPDTPGGAIAVTPATVTDDGVATVTYKSGDVTTTITRDLNADIGGPCRVVVEAAEASSGVMQAHLRGVPIKEAARRLEEVWIAHRAERLFRRLPEDFTGDHSFARLAEVIVTLHGWNVRNPVGVVARNCSPHEHSTWATRVKRARERGFMTPGSEMPALTARAVAVLGGLS